MSADFTLKWNGAQVEAMIKSGSVEGLTNACEYVLGESNAHVPLETGDLERSGTVTIDPGEQVGHISYSGPCSVVQHERLDFKHDSGRNAKFLENALKNRAQIAALIAAPIRARLS